MNQVEEEAVLPMLDLAMDSLFTDAIITYRELSPEQQRMKPEGAEIWYNEPNTRWMDLSEDERSEIYRCVIQAKELEIIEESFKEVKT